MKSLFNAVQLSSLAKVFPNKIYGKEASFGDYARGQDASYQIALMGDGGAYAFRVETELKSDVSVYRVGYVPSQLSAYPQAHDDNYLTVDSGMFPDPLFPATDGKFFLTDGEYLTLWINILIDENEKAGEYPVKVRFFKENNEVCLLTYILKIHNVALPEQTLNFTQWFHADCIADYHGAEVFSELHWELIGKYIALAARHGMNMILTPVLTPPLDTEVGGERTTVQLAKIVKRDNGYDIDLSRLEKFIDIAIANGIKNFEINHFFTQWGARFAPKVIAEVDGEEKRIFGWETDATSPEYIEFLNCLVPKIIATFEKKGIDKTRLYFHVSDEPNGEQLESYRQASSVLKPLITGCNHMDALSHFEYYSEGLVSTPVVGSNALEPFIENGVEGLWCYYCCAQAREVANRFFSMPSARNRIIGTQIYKYGIAGFLHWGYNFYNTQYSKKHISPYEVTDAGGAFPSGDAFSVYPYENGVIPSLRQKVFKEAIDDVRFLKYVESVIGKDRTVALIEEVSQMSITFKKYPRSEEFFKELYKRAFEILEG